MLEEKKPREREHERKDAKREKRDRARSREDTDVERIKWRAASSPVPASSSALSSSPVSVTTTLPRFPALDDSLLSRGHHHDQQQSPSGPTLWPGLLSPRRKHGSHHQHSPSRHRKTEPPPH